MRGSVPNFLLFLVSSRVALTVLQYPTNGNDNPHEFCATCISQSLSKLKTDEGYNQYVDDNISGPITTEMCMLYRPAEQLSPAPQKKKKIFLDRVPA